MTHYHLEPLQSETMEQGELIEDPVNTPKHYQLKCGVQVVEVIESVYPENYHLATVLKYLLRAPFKGKFKEDVLKAQWHLNRYVESL